MIKVSVIIPVYKVEQYIEKCVRSLMEQTMKEGIEYLFINDCSPDDSMGVLKRTLDDYPERISQARFFNLPENHKTAYVRTLGLKEAHGEYVIFCDADDWVDVEMYEMMFQTAKENDVDIVVCNHIRHSKEGQFPSKYHYRRNPSEVIRFLYEQDLFKFSPLWNKLIRGAIFREYNCFPYPGINQSEDLNMLVRVFCHARSLYHLEDKYYYHYNRLNVNSICETPKDNHQLWLDRKRNAELITAFLMEQDPKLYRFTCNNLKFYTKNWFRKEMSSRDFFYTWRESHRDILHYKTSPLKARIIEWVFYRNFWLYQLLNKITA